jgi:zinc protease
LATFGGQSLEKEKTAGLYQLWSRTLARGTEDYSYWELTRELESMAGSLSAFSGRSTCGVSGSFLSADWVRGLELLAEVWMHPSFPEKELEKAKAEQRAALRAQLDSPPGRTFLAFRKLFYGDHPYGLNSLGTPETLAGFTGDDLKKAHASVKGLDGAVLTVVGDVEPDEVLAKVRRLLGKKTQKAVQLNLALPKPHKKPAFQKLSDAKAKQTQIVIGFAAPSATDPKRHSARILQAILGGMGGRLFRDLRDVQSLAYTVQPFYSDSLKTGVFGVYMAVGAGKEEKALAGLRNKLTEIAQNPPTEQEMKRAKAYILGARDIGLQTNSALAGTMAIDELLGLGFDYYQKMPQDLMAVGAGQISETARKILDFNQVVRVTMGRNSEK